MFSARGSLSAFSSSQLSRAASRFAKPAGQSSSLSKIAQARPAISSGKPPCGGVMFMPMPIIAHSVKPPESELSVSMPQTLRSPR